jgi:hypothetical protein
MPTDDNRIRLQIQVDPHIHELLFAELASIPAGAARTERIKLLATEALLLRSMRNPQPQFAESFRAPVARRQTHQGSIQSTQSLDTNSFSGNSDFYSASAYNEHPGQTVNAAQNQFETAPAVVVRAPHAPDPRGTLQPESAARRAARGLSDSLLGG